MSNWYKQDEEGDAVACDLIELGDSYKDKDARVVASDYVGKIHISTVFLGIDHSFTEGTKPVLWETMIFGGEHDGYQERYTSVVEAMGGHARALQAVLESEKNI